MNRQKMIILTMHLGLSCGSRSVGVILIIVAGAAESFACPVLYTFPFRDIFPM